MIRKGEEFQLFGKVIPKGPFFEGIELLHFTDSSFGSFLLHDHDYIEIMLILDGNIELAVEGERYHVPRGSLAVIPPQRVHRTIIPPGTKRYERMVLHIFPEYLGLIMEQFILEQHRFGYTQQVHILEYAPDPFWIFRTLFERAFYTSHQSETYQKLVIPCLVVELFAELEHGLDVQAAPPIPATNNLVSKVVDYIDEHFTEPGLTVDDIRSSVYVSQGYLSRIFKSYTGSSIYNFLTYKRLVYAKELLTGEETVLNACIACGFTDYTSFLKSFKKAFGMTPTQYRKRYLEMQKSGAAIPEE